MFIPSYHRNKTGEVRIPNFTGGLNLSENVTDINDNQLVEAQNLRIDNGIVKTREALTLVPCDNFELSDTEILDATSTVSLYLSNTLANPAGTESEELGYYVNNDYIFKIVLFLDKIIAVCVYSADENETGVSKGHIAEFALNVADTDSAIVSAISGLNFKRVVLLNDGAETPITDAYDSIISTNTVTGFITYSDTTDLNYSVTFSLLNSDGEFEPSFILKARFSDTAYVPTTVINKDVTRNLNVDAVFGDNRLSSRVSGGTPFEDFNLIGTAFKETFFERIPILENGSAIVVDGVKYTSTEFVDPFNEWYISLSNEVELTTEKPITIKIIGKWVTENDDIGSYIKAVLTAENEDSRFYLYSETDELVDCYFNTFDSGLFSKVSEARYDGTLLTFAVYYSIDLENYNPDGACFKDVYIDRVEITANVPDTAITDNINAYSYAEWFGGARSGLEGGTRLFVAGNPTNANMIRWSALNDVSYFPENNFAIIGRGDEPITALAKQADFLAVFTPSSLWAVEYAYDVNADTNATTVYFPTTPISPQFGCDCPNTIQLINDKLTWAHSTGAIYTLVNQNQFSERNVKEISAHIRPLLQAEGDNLKTALSADYKGQYIIFAGLNAYVWDYEQASLYNYSSSEKAQERLVFLKWVLPIAPSAVFSEKNSLLLYAEVEVESQFAQRLFEFADAEYDESMDETGDIEVAITTKFKTKEWNFGKPQLYKQIMRLFLGLGSEYEYTATLSYTTDIGTLDSESEISNAKRFDKGDDVFVVRCNIKKSRIIQLALETDTPVKINTLNIEYGELGEVK